MSNIRTYITIEKNIVFPCYSCAVPPLPQTHSKLGCPCRFLMEAEHDDLQTVTAVGAFEEARLQQVRRIRGGQVNPPIRQTVTVGGQKRADKAERL